MPQRRTSAEFQTVQLLPVDDFAAKLIDHLNWEQIQRQLEDR